MHPALRKGPLFYKTTPFSTFFYKKHPPILFLAYGPGFMFLLAQRTCERPFSSRTETGTRQGVASVIALSRVHATCTEWFKTCRERRTTARSTSPLCLPISLQGGHNVGEKNRVFQSHKLTFPWVIVRKSNVITTFIKGHSTPTPAI